MMRDEMISAVILALLISLFVYSSVTVETHTKNLVNLIKDAEKHIDDSKAQEKFNTVLENWGKEKKRLFYICSHNIILDIDENINLGVEYIEYGDKDRALYSIKKARLLLIDLCEKEKIRLDNIF